MPEFMAMGMTPEQFYEGHSWLVVSYKRAYRIKRQRDNFDSYIMAGYVYDLLSRLAPMFNPFTKEKCEPMREKPFDLFSGLSEEAKKPRPQDKARTFMEVFAARHNVAMAKERERKEKDAQKLEKLGNLENSKSEGGDNNG